MSQIEDIVKAEAQKLIDALEGEVNDPIERAAVAAMTNDLAMLPIRMARGEDVSLLVQSLKAEAAARGVAVSMRAQAAMQQAWINIVVKVLSATLLAL